MEQITFDAAVDPPQLVFRLTMMSLDWPNSLITIQLRPWDGTSFGDRIITATYTGDDAKLLMNALDHKVDTRAESLTSRIIKRLKADNKIPAGALSGTPD